MESVSPTIRSAFERLAKREGFAERPEQIQLAYLIGDFIASGQRGLLEAPTGLGKSLAALVPSIVHAALNGKRIAIATYTNVLAEQYWTKDLPLALSLLDVPDSFKVAFLIGRQRYACLMELEPLGKDIAQRFAQEASLGIESDWRDLGLVPHRQLSQTWRQIAVPPVCPARLCPKFQECFYYSARKKAQSANLILTNHSVVMQDGLAALGSDDGAGLLGPLDFLVIDEAHDLPQAAAGALEYELGQPKLASLSSLASRVERALSERLGGAGAHLLNAYRREIDACARQLSELRADIPEAIVGIAPPDLATHAGVASMRRPEDEAKRLAHRVAEATRSFTDGVLELLATEAEKHPEGSVRWHESVLTYVRYMDETCSATARLFAIEDGMVTQLNTKMDAKIRSDVVDVAPRLANLVLDRVPYVALSATLSLDGDFDFFKRTSGALPDFEEVLASPFDYSTQAACYLPPSDRILEPGTARREGLEELYFSQIASELTQIIEIMQGRTLALFHSRREMEGVAAAMSLPEDLPLLIQPKGSAAVVGKRFRVNRHASLFALRSFWTGFDAPGDTLSCVAIVRVPFEVPFEPVSVTRMALLQSRGLDPFLHHTLPNAKMMMRQGVGRLIRRDTDRGIIALLDPRLRSKRYGEEILANLPQGMRVFSDFADSAGYLGF